MNRKNTIPDISYYRLLLLDFLRESHPEMILDKSFIAARSETAAEIHFRTVVSGGNQTDATEQANAALFENLYFSKYDMLVNILWNEFANEIPEDEAKSTAIRLLPECESIFAKYPLNDDFADTAEYELLYTELTGTVALYLENHN